MCRLLLSRFFICVCRCRCYLCVVVGLDMCSVLMLVGIFRVFIIVLFVGGLVMLVSVYLILSWLFLLFVLLLLKML